MGYVHKPIPLDILLKMPPDIRRKALERDRAFLKDVQKRQGAILAPIQSFVLWLLMAAVSGAVIVIKHFDLF